MRANPEDRLLVIQSRSNSGIGLHVLDDRPLDRFTRSIGCKTGFGVQAAVYAADTLSFYPISLAGGIGVPWYVGGKVMTGIENDSAAMAIAKIALTTATTVGCVYGGGKYFFASIERGDRSFEKLGKRFKQARASIVLKNG